MGGRKHTNVKQVNKMEKDMIKVAKKYCEYKESPYTCVYTIKMPNKSRFDSYSVDVSAYIVYDEDYFYAIKKPNKSDYLFTLVKIGGREDGKRYARPKLTWEEFVEELQAYDKEIDVADSPKALVSFWRYTYDKWGREEGREKEYCVGRIKGKWFIEEDGYKRHRLSADGVTLLRENLTDDEYTNYEQKLKALFKIDRAILVCERKIDGLIEELDNLRENTKFPSHIYEQMDRLQRSIEDFIEEKQEEKRQIIAFLEQEK